jgi:hypothetical protein
MNGTSEAPKSININIVPSEKYIAIAKEYYSVVHYIVGTSGNWGQERRKIVSKSRLADIDVIIQYLWAHDTASIPFHI